MKLNPLLEANRVFWLEIQQELIEVGFEDAQIVKADEARVVFELRIYSTTDTSKLALHSEGYGAKYRPVSASLIARNAYSLAKLFDLA